MLLLKERAVKRVYIFNQKCHKMFKFSNNSKKFHFQQKILNIFIFSSFFQLNPAEEKLSENIFLFLQIMNEEILSCL